MNKLLIPIAAMVCLLPACNYSPCDCEEYSKLEAFRANLEKGDTIDSYSALLQEAQDLKIQLANRKALLAKVPSVKTRIRVLNAENARPSEASEITSGHSYDLITSKLAAAQDLIEAQCAYRGYVTIEFPVEINQRISSFEDLDGTLTGDKSECIHKILHDMTFDTTEVKLLVRHTFFVRNPKGKVPAKSAQIEPPSPIEMKQALERVQSSLEGKCGTPQSGDITLNFKIDSHGKPYDITAIKDNTKDPEIGKCITEQLELAELPSFPDHYQPPVTYVFHN